MNLEELVPERYRVYFNKENNAFRILDTWHATIKNLNLEENPELSDDSPALKTLSSEEINAVVRELIKIGWLDKIINSKTGHEIVDATSHKTQSTTDHIIDKIAEVTLDDGQHEEPHSSVTKDAISALKEIASKL